MSERARTENDIPFKQRGGCRTGVDLKSGSGPNQFREGEPGAVDQGENQETDRI